MTLSANSYGTVTQVTAMVPRYASNGEFNLLTRPTYSQVETWIDQTSALINVILAQEGFTIPVTQTDAKSMLAGLVVSACADRAEFANRSGRFFSEVSIERGVSMEKVLREEISAWISDHADGLEALGADREGTDETNKTFSHTPIKSDGYHDYAES